MCLYSTHAGHAAAVPGGGAGSAKMLRNVRGHNDIIRFDGPCEWSSAVPWSNPVQRPVAAAPAWHCVMLRGCMATMREAPPNLREHDPWHIDTDSHVPHSPHSSMECCCAPRRAARRRPSARAARGSCGSVTPGGAWPFLRDAHPQWNVAAVWPWAVVPADLRLSAGPTRRRSAAAAPAMAAAHPPLCGGVAERDVLAVHRRRSTPDDRKSPGEPPWPNGLR